MNSFKTLFMFLILVFVSACANQPIVLKSGQQPKTLELCLDFAREINSDDKLLYLDAVNTFIIDFNQKVSGRQVKPCINGQHQTINLTIQNTRYVTPGKQALYTIVSILGIAYPLSGGNIGFVWIGGSTSTIGVKLSADIAESQKTRYRQFSSSPYFMNLAAVKKKHMDEFQLFLFELFEELNKEGIKKSEKIL